MSNRNSTIQTDSIGPDDPTVVMTVPVMNLPLCARCQHEMAYADTDLAATVELPSLLRRQAE